MKTHKIIKTKLTKQAFMQSVLSICVLSSLASPAANAMVDYYMGPNAVTNMTLPSVTVLSNGANPTQMKKLAFPPKWQADVKTTKFSVVRIKSWSVVPYIGIAADPAMGFSADKMLASGPEQKASGSFGTLKREVVKHISGDIYASSLENFAVSACKTHVDYLRQIKHLSNKEIFSIDRKIPVRAYDVGKMRTTHLNGLPWEFTSIQSAAVAGYITCQKHIAPDYNGSYAAPAKDLGIAKVFTLPARSMANLNETCPAKITLGTIVYANRKGVLKTYIEYKDKSGKITKGPKRNINTGPYNPSTNQTLTEFADYLSLPVAKPASPKPSGNSLPGSFKAEEKKPEVGALPGNSQYVHSGAIRIVVKTGQGASVKPGGSSTTGDKANANDEVEYKSARASKWLPYKLVCKKELKFNPAIGTMGGIAAAPNPTHSKFPGPAGKRPGKMTSAVKPATKPAAATIVPARVIQPAARKTVDVSIVRAKRSAGNSVSASIKNTGNSDAKMCNLHIQYKARIGKRNKDISLGTIAAGKTTSKSVKLTGLKNKEKIHLKVQCRNESAGKTVNNQKTL